VAGALTNAFDRSPASIVAEKLGRAATEETDQMRRGVALETAVIDAAALLLGAEVKGRQVEVPYAAEPYLVATCDAVIRFNDKSLLFPLEVKTTSGEYPEEYLLAQLTAQMICCGVEVGFSGVWHVRTGTLVVREHQLENAIANAVLQMATRLWTALSDGTVPEPVFPSDSSLWNKLYPDSAPGRIELPKGLVESLRQAKEAARAAQAKYELYEAEVKERLGDFELGVIDGVPVVRWKTGTWHRIDTVSLEEKYPAIAEEFRLTSTQRRFTLIAPTSKRKEVKR
jgi:predicted phage-related endonuclease